MYQNESFTIPKEMKWSVDDFKDLYFTMRDFKRRLIERHQTKEDVMSYSLATKCNTCEKKDKCTDRHFIEGAISGIHQVYPPEKGHLGSGTIELNCNNYAEKQTKK